jgi:hypothetical protein
MKLAVETGDCGSSIQRNEIRILVDLGDGRRESAFIISRADGLFESETIISALSDLEKRAAA